MLNVYVNKRKRRVWSPGTIAVSIGAHVLLLAGAVTAAVGHEKPIERVSIIDLGNVPEAKPKTPPPPVIEPEKPSAPEPPAKVVEGDHRVVEEVRTVPTELPEVNPNEKFNPEEYSGEGVQAGNKIVENPAPSPGPVPPGNPEPAGDGPMEAEMVEELPSLANRSETERMSRRLYPALLRDAGVAGRTVVTLIIDAEGKVEPGSVRVQETTHEEFSAAAVRLAEKMRFRPAKLNNRAVPVVISIPIEWKLES